LEEILSVSVSMLLVWLSWSENPLAAPLQIDVTGANTLPLEQQAAPLAVACLAVPWRACVDRVAACLGFHGELLDDG
jgi:hypothetical protein